MTAQWLEITLHSTNDADTDRIEAALEAAGAIAITYTAADDEEIYEPPRRQHAAVDAHRRYRPLSAKQRPRKPSTSCCAQHSATTSR